MLLAGGPVALTPTDHLLEESMHHAFRRSVRDAIADLPASQPAWPAFTALDLEDEDVMVFDGYAPGLPPGAASRAEAEVRDGRCDALVSLGLVR